MTALTLDDIAASYRTTKDLVTTTDQRIVEAPSLAYIFHDEHLLATITFYSTHDPREIAAHLIHPWAATRVLLSAEGHVAFGPLGAPPPSDPETLHNNDPWADAHRALVHTEFTPETMTILIEPYSYESPPLHLHFDEPVHAPVQDPPALFATAFSRAAQVPSDVRTEMQTTSGMDTLAYWTCRQLEHKAALTVAYLTEKGMVYMHTNVPDLLDRGEQP